jgi:hypothetical protein
VKKSLGDLKENIATMSFDAIMKKVHQLPLKVRINILADLTPIVGDIKGFFESVFGVNTLGEKLSDGERAFGVGVLLAGPAGMVAKRMRILKKVSDYLAQVPKSPPRGSLAGQRGAIGNMAWFGKKNNKRIESGKNVIKKGKIDTFSVHKLDGLDTRKVNYLRKEQSNMIHKTDLQSFAIQNKNMLELTKEGNNWIEARLKNMNNFIEYTTSIMKNNTIPEAEKLNAKYIRKELLKDIKTMLIKMNNAPFEIEETNEYILSTLFNNLK